MRRGKEDAIGGRLGRGVGSYRVRKGHGKWWNNWIKQSTTVFAREPRIRSFVIEEYVWDMGP